MGLAEKSKSKSTKNKLRNQESLTELPCTDSGINGNGKDNCETESSGILQNNSGGNKLASQPTKVTRTQTRKEKPVATKRKTQNKKEKPTATKRKIQTKEEKPTATKRKPQSRKEKTDETKQKPQSRKEKTDETKQKRSYKRKAENATAIQTAPLEFSESKTEESVSSQLLSSASQDYDSIPSSTVKSLSRKEQSNKLPKSPECQNRKRSVNTDNKKASGRSTTETTVERISGKSGRKYSKRNNTSEQEAEENEVNTTSAEHQTTQKQTGKENLRRSQRSRSPVNIITTDTDVRSRPDSLEREYRKPKPNLSSGKREHESRSETPARRNMQQTSEEYSKVNDGGTGNTATPNSSESLAHANARTSKRSHHGRSPDKDLSVGKNTDEIISSSERSGKKTLSKSSTKNSLSSDRIPLSAKQLTKPIKGRSKSEKSKKRPVSTSRKKTTTAKTGIKTRTTRKDGRNTPKKKRYKKA